jgi:glutathione S-transferase
MPMLRLLGRKSSSNVRKVIWALEELQVRYEREDVGGEFGRNRDPEFLALNPNGLVPVLIDGDLTLWESNSILRYLGAKYGDGALWESDPGKRALIDRWMDWQLTVVTPPVSLLTMALVFKPPKPLPPEEIGNAREKLARAFRILDRELSGKSFLGGDRLSLADIAVGLVAYRWLALPIERESVTNLQRWYAGLSARPAFVSSVPV